MFKLHSFLAPALAVASVACGARFGAHENALAAGGTGNAGEASGGFTNSAGTASSNAGDTSEPEAGGSSSAGGSTTGVAGTFSGTGGAASAIGGSAGSAGFAGATGGGGSGGHGGFWSGNGGAAGASCATLRQEYQAAVQKARACDKGSTDQCSPNSLAQPVGGCGCPVAINTSSEASVAAKQAYKAYQDNKCEYGDPICDIFCAPPTMASCEPSAPPGTFVCVARTNLK
jgi:hypothetical protein